MKLSDVKWLTCYLIIAFALNLDAQTIQEDVALGDGVIGYKGEFNLPYSQSNEEKPNTSSQKQRFVDPTTRSSVVSFYKNQYLPNLYVPMGWTGNVNSCQAGNTSQSYLDATFAMVNYFRGMVNLGAVVNNTSLNANAQEAALMMSANNDLSHYPPNTWTCYSAAGAQAAGTSNIALGISGPNAIIAYMEDFGSFNQPVGHRRWILYPRAAEFGVGSVGETTRSANALQVIGTATTGRPATDIVAWPPEGYVPNTVVYNRWSFSLNNSPGANFSAATVTMTENGTPIPLNIISRTDNGYGDNTLVWEPDSLNFPGGQADRVINVNVSGISNATQSSYSYQVIVINPEYLSDVIFKDGFE